MKEFLLVLEGFNTVSIAVRLAVAMICGGIIGLEREHKRRAAGFRTHILVCVGSAMTPMIGEYLLTLRAVSPENFAADPLRLAAQVIAGMGFIGAGTIIVTRRRQVKGLTTAAGLWTAAIVGIAAGAGCYIEALFACLLVLFTELVFSKIEYFLMASARAVNVYVEFTDKKELYRILDVIRARGIEILDSEISKNPEYDGINAIFTLKFPRKYRHDEIVNEIMMLESVRQVEEL
ncbi:MAG: MgtC/SapB family protein [Clostridia bacterium]|nr:MgtC/SapB family protein [Clostridia bacterium]